VRCLDRSTCRAHEGLQVLREPDRSFIWIATIPRPAMSVRYVDAVRNIQIAVRNSYTNNHNRDDSTCEPRMASAREWIIISCGCLKRDFGSGHGTGKADSGSLTCSLHSSEWHFLWHKRRLLLQTLYTFKTVVAAAFHE
jgi:hypothetical protein